jgi:dTDP-4-amino-4,6-dideoxygalactose transaminase
MKPLREIASKLSLGLVEDGAQAHCATYESKPAGAFSDATCWSLYASKNMMTGEGGMITTNDDQIDDTLRMIRTHGEKAKYSSMMLGSNYRMFELQAAIGIVQLKKLPSFIAKRRKNAQQLTDILKKTSKLILPYETTDRQHSWYLYTARLKDGTETQRNKLLEDLKKKGIGAEAYYVNPVHLMPFYRENYPSRILPQTEKASKQVFSLPIHPGVTEEDITVIGETVLSLV